MSRIFVRRLSSSAPLRSSAPFTPDARWLSQSSARIGACLTFGCGPEQTKEAGAVLEELGCDWRELVAGSEGYLTGKGYRGLWKHGVVWGDQDLMMMFLQGFVYSPKSIETFAVLQPSDEFPGHVNNVTYVRYAESSRTNSMENYANIVDPANKDAWAELCSSRGTGLILRSIKIDYKFPMKYPDRVTALHKLNSLPEANHDSMFFDVIMLSEKHRRPVARVFEDIVLYDYRKGQKLTLDKMPFMLDVFRETFRLQEQAKAGNRERALKLEERIVALEKSSWDRKDAVESFGSAGNTK